MMAIYTNGFSQNKQTTTKAVTPVTKTTTPVTKATIPGTKVITPVTKSTTPLTKAILPVQVKDTVKIASQLETAVVDSIIKPVLKFKPYKKNSHASYYHDKFNGKQTASGKKFDNKKYTAAHRKFPFGTKLRITNEATGKSVIVEVADRGPFSRGREIDLTKKAFMEISDGSGGGSMKVTIEEELK